MTHLIIILGTLTLLAGFFALTAYEARRGVRVFSAGRTRLDAQIARIYFILEHVDLSAFLRDEVRRLVGRIGHDIAHLSLQAVRVAERVLTRLVRYLRTKHEVDITPRETARPFVQSLSDFKDRLKAARPENSEITEIQ
ncbi:MAG: hypothetical protein PHD04_03790 [Candidatus Pacebacteria bacterium]|nr:hypothetical protein [Candidatus Paceibacterota bacterium]